MPGKQGNSDPTEAEQGGVKQAEIARTFAGRELEDE
jgi:hypothetical protein